MGDERRGDVVGDVGDDFVVFFYWGEVERVFVDDYDLFEIVAL